MRFRTLALALALSCGLAAIGEAKQKTVVHHPSRAVKGKAGGKAPKFKPGKYKARKQVVKKRVVKH
ncbi:exported hypothetical protein [Candidatus Sulfopaludibacter sp. SbA3]|nr:exported hypothetical protein [Candidatus Sulfopaludibacter sp. SbA3]